MSSFFGSIDLAFKTFEPQTVAELQKLLDDIALDAKAGAKPIIHFDTHGSKNDGILIQATGELLPWLDICDQLRNINVKTGNNLCIISAACFSAHLMKRVTVTQACPFFLMLAPEDTHTSGCD